MKNIWRVVLPFLLLSGCCANDACDCNDLLEDALYFRLDTSVYSPQDIDTVYFQRFALPDTTAKPMAPDTSTRPITAALIIRKQRRSQTLINQLQAKGVDTTGLVILANTFPFAPLTTGGNIGVYRYKIEIRKGDRPNKPPQYIRPTVSYDLRHLIIRGRYNADGCCTCYQNTRKQFYLDDTRITRPYDNSKLHTVTENGGSPQVTLLNKPLPK